MGTAPGVYLREDPICGTQLENQSELRAPTADKAALYLDAALAARSATGEDTQTFLSFYWGVSRHKMSVMGSSMCFSEN